MRLVMSEAMVCGLNDKWQRSTTGGGCCRLSKEQMGVAVADLQLVQEQVGAGEDLHQVRPPSSCRGLGQAVLQESLHFRDQRPFEVVGDALQPPLQDLQCANQVLLRAVR